MSTRLIYLFLILRPTDQEALERVMKQLTELERTQGGCDETRDPDRN